MNNHLRTSDVGLTLIKHFEGFRAKAYICPAGVLTIGYGTTRGVRKGQAVTESEATELLKRDVFEFELAIKNAVQVKLTQFQFDALVSFVYNVGPANFRSSTLLRLLNQGDYAAVPAQLARWNKAAGRVLEGLTRRRHAEGQLYTFGVLGF